MMGFRQEQIRQSFFFSFPVYPGLDQGPIIALGIRLSHCDLSEFPQGDIFFSCQPFLLSGQRLKCCEAERGDGGCQQTTDTALRSTTHTYIHCTEHRKKIKITTHAPWPLQRWKQDCDMYHRKAGNKKMEERNERQTTRSWLISVFCDQISLLSFSLTHSAFYSLSLCHAASLPKEKSWLSETRSCFLESNSYSVIFLPEMQQYNRFICTNSSIYSCADFFNLDISIYIYVCMCEYLISHTFAILPSMGHKSIAVIGSGS